MTFPSRSRWLVAAAALLVLLIVAAPGAAFADTLTWSGNSFGLQPIPNPSENGPDFLPTASRFNDVALYSGSRGWAVGAWTDAPTQYGTAKYPLVAFTDNAGSTWSTTTVPADQTPGTEFYGVAMPSSDVMVAVSSSGKIARRSGGFWTIDAIATWPTTGTRALRAISMDNGRGWAVGDLGGVAKTVDGITWTKVVAPTTGNPALYDVSILPDGSAIAVGEGGAIRKLTTSGVTAITSPITSNLRGVAFVTATHGFAVGDNGVLIETSDAGAHWSNRAPLVAAGVSPSASSLRGLAFAADGRGLAVGAYETVWRTTDAGESWTPGKTSAGANELHGVSLAADAPSNPVVVGAYYHNQLSGSDHQAVAYRGTWTGFVTPPPAAPTSVTVAASLPGPRIIVSWPASLREDGYVIERSSISASGPWTGVATTTADVTSWTDTSVDWSSTWHYRVKAFNAAGSSAWVQSAPFQVDAAAPVTTSDAAVLYVAAATVTLSATDNSGSGVAFTEWTLDGQAGTGLVVQTSVIGPHTLQYRSTDAAGNVESWKSVSFFVSDNTVPDTTKPVTTVIGSVYSYYAAPAQISLAATDAGGSGVFNTYCRLNGGAAMATTTVSVNTTGTYLLEYWSVDLAGNVENVHAMSFKVTIRPDSTGKPTRPVTPLTVTRSKSFSTYGYVRRYSKTYSLKLYFYRYESGKWVYKLYDTTSQERVSVPGDDFNRYRASTSLTRSGKWRVRAKHVVGSKTVYSAYQYFTVN